MSDTVVTPVPVSNGAPSPGSADGQSSTASSSPDSAPVTKTSEAEVKAHVEGKIRLEGKTPTRAEIVKALLDRRLEKDGKIIPPRTAPKSTKDVPPVSDGTADETADSASTASPDNADTAEAKPESSTEKTEEKPETKDDNDDAVLAKRLARIAQEENKVKGQQEQVQQYAQQLDQQRQQIEQYRGHIERFHQFTTAFSQDPIDGFHALGLSDKHVEALYWRLNDHIIKSGGLQRQQPQFGPDQAREIARQEWEQQQVQQQQYNSQQMVAALEAAKQIYAGRVNDAFNAGVAKYPAVKAVGVSIDRIHQYVQDAFNQTGKAPSPDETLAYFESQYQQNFEASGYKRQVEAPAKKTGTTVTQEWSTGSGPVNGSNGKPMTLKESKDEIRRKLDAGFYKRQRTD